MASSNYSTIPDVSVSINGFPPEFQPILQALSAMKATLDLLTGATKGYNAITKDQIRTQQQSQAQAQPSSSGVSVTYVVPGGATIVYADGSDYQRLWQDVYVLFNQVQSIQSQVNSILANMSS